MEKHHFFVKLIPPRATFARDMTEDEQLLMKEHAAYMRRFYERGEVLAYGPVRDPDGSFGIALVEMASQAEVEEFANNDPTIRAGLCRYTVAPMMLAGVQGSR